jgi:hypothetical protein
MFFGILSFIMAFPDRFKEVGGLSSKNVWCLGAMWLPNAANPYKLWLNLSDPIGQMIHDSHKQHPVAMVDGIEYDMVEHYLRGKLRTIDVVARDEYRQGFLPRVRQIFDRRFYMGHDRNFPQAFRLINRTIVKPGSGFDKDAHVREVVNSVHRIYEGPIQVFPFSALVQRILSVFFGNKTCYSPALAFSL